MRHRQQRNPFLDEIREAYIPEHMNCQCAHCGIWGAYERNKGYKIDLCDDCWGKYPPKEETR